MQELSLGTFSPFPNSMTPELIKNCLYGLNAFLAGVIAIAFTAFCRPAPQRDKYLAIAIGVVAAFLVALVTEAAQNPQINDKTYIILGVGFCFCLVSIALFWKTWDTEAPQDDRTILLGFVRREVSNRLQAMGVLSKYIPGRVNPKVESQDDRNSSSMPPSGIFKGIVSKVKVLFGGQEQDVLPGMAIADIFNQDAAKELLILGAPGGGKTTALLTLAMQLCEEAEKDIGKPIPIVLELSSWQPAEEIPHWIALQLKAKYQLSEATCQEYLKGGRFVLLLDGLDELKDDKDACIEAINQFRTKRGHEFQQVVVCSRLIDYEEATKRLQIARAYCLLELNDAEIETYLTDPNPPALVSPLWAKLKADPNGFLKLARQPLLLDLIRKTYTDELLPFPVMTPNPDPEQYKKDCQERLLADYVEHQLEENHNHRGYDPRKTKHYLEWLAQNLKRETTTEFLLEKMQPSWLECHRQKWYRLATGLIVGLIGGLIVGLIVKLIGGLIVGLIIGLIGGLILGMIDIEPYEVLNLNLSAINTKKFRAGMILGMIIGMIGGIISGLIIGMIEGLIVGLIVGLIFGLIVGLIFGLIFGLQGSLRLRENPNEGIWKSGQNVIILTILSYPFTIALQTLLNFITNRPIDLLSVLLSSIGASLFLGIYMGGGVAFIKHFVLRYFLIRAGHIPRDYVGFLKYAEERGLILQNGGSFRFYHDLLREHLAGNPWYCERKWCD